MKMDYIVPTVDHNREELSIDITNSDCMVNDVIGKNYIKCRIDQLQHQPYYVFSRRKENYSGLYRFFGLDTVHRFMCHTPFHIYWIREVKLLIDTVVHKHGDNLYSDNLELYDRKRFDLNMFEYETQRKAVCYCGHSIIHHSNPSPELQLLAVKQDGWCISEIPLSSNNEFQVAAIRQDPRSIGMINNPSIKLQKMAIEYNPEVISYIQTPSDNVQLLALKINPKIVIYIRNPSKRVSNYIQDTLGVVIRHR